MRAVIVECEGCGLAITDSEPGRTWMQTALGLRAAVTHRSQECARLAVAKHSEQPARRVPRPVAREDKVS